MLTLMTLGGLVLAAVLTVFVLGAAVFLLKAMLTLVLLPFRVIGFALHLVFLPIKLLLGLLFLPLLFIGGVVGMIGLALAGIAAIVAPLAPLVLLVVVVWAIAKGLARPRAALVR